MPVIFNEDEVPKEHISEGVSVQRLITPESVKSDYLYTERLHLEPNAVSDFSVDSDSLVWFHVISGSLLLYGEFGEKELSGDYFVLLPPSLEARVSTTEGALLFKATVPQAYRFDQNWRTSEMGIRFVDWTKEPVLNSEYDERRRIYMLTPRLSGTKVAKGEMIIYPPGTKAANHHHEGAEHFQVILTGNATFYVDNVPHSVRAGDTIYIYDNEQHYFINDGKEELSFIEYFVPGVYKTVWAEGANICTWSPSGLNIKGGMPSREVKAHSSAEAHTIKEL